MTADLMPFVYEGATVRTVVINGEPWFVLADLCVVLDIANPRNVAARLSEDQKGVRSVDTPGGQQPMTLVNESGMYEVVIRSDKPGAVTFRRWLTAEVLPAIRKTGNYSTAPALTEDELIHRALEVSARRVAVLTERVAELEPKAEVADKLLTADGDLSVRDAAQALTRAGIKTGQGRLFATLNDRRWISRAGDGRWRVMQSAIDRGYMSVLPQSHYHPKTGELVMDPPQPRVTPKGLQRLLADLDST
ncbi:BRO family protein [Nocardia sp. CA-290969]|uniref:BRO family protein n=1 Tax=Nocardia sp. CA-290969 TaxID=3239986 RepID=UPI003D92E035